MLWWRLFFHQLFSQLVDRFCKAKPDDFLSSPFHYNPVWKIGEENYNSNKCGELLEESDESDESEDFADQEIFVNRGENTALVKKQDGSINANVSQLDKIQLKDSTSFVFASTLKSPKSSGSMKNSIKSTEFSEPLHNSVKSLPLLTRNPQTDNPKKAVSEAGTVVELIRKMRVNKINTAVLPSDEFSSDDEELNNVDQIVLNQEICKSL